jgi:hypothetical protein
MLNTLAASCPRLSKLSVAYPHMELQHLDDLAHEMETATATAGGRSISPFQFQDMTALANLSTLSLYNLYYDLPTWRHQLVTVLQQSPNLRHLETFCGPIRTSAQIVLRN